ncbi:MAG: bifunctional methylenetetrahydrofolate dehydrogenase/methenyltetrahydrofolate cyclohydrolase FolD [Bacteroidetes bacterium]|nr:bifunctional methylenetetrahydrofolate dehydrogenase/methenyltetrahydrofolate cyclohydrolase FolD [Bacteroidota bacterium]MDA0904212.1 bifunctional methylenetetrahydrofolate dehydrogenase/methenyltetrahydrofolate cyclohydrolase FolD [Bacteroidota bacterium]MDA1242962.1 bifunctional methylenetetrahydrofolate dehydrogenase/methenyltetrahydrofolate cyclohydrolase FolD [Bacteroidota bacterium]
MTQILDGKHWSSVIESELAHAVESRKARGLKAPHLAAVLVGNNPASRAYVGHKVKACARVGFQSTLVERPEQITQEELLGIVNDLNTNPEVDGFIVQLPLPDHIDAAKVLEAVNPAKDVDGFHPVNAGKMALGLPCHWPATPMGIMTLLERSGIETSGKHAVILGRSDIVGTPMTLLLRRNGYPGNCTVTMCHSRTRDLHDHTRRADLLIAAIGKPHFVTADMVKPGVVIIDVGINRIADPSKASGHRLTGDVDFDQVAPKCSWITPVPGGVGPMTIASLMQNTLQACEAKHP